MDSSFIKKNDSSFDNMINESSFKNVTHIKEWISTKLNQLEEKNQILKEENKKVNEELNKLKERYVKKSYTPEARRRFIKRNHHHYYNVMHSYSKTNSSSSDNDNDSSSSSDLVSTYYKNHKLTNRNQTFSRKSKSSSLDRKLSKMKKFNFERARNYRKNLDFVTLNRISKNRRLENHHQDNNLKNNKPPTPPLHRFPSWESRIYEIANNGIQSTLSTPIQQFKKLDFINFEKKIQVNFNPNNYSSIFPDRYGNSTESIIMNHYDLLDNNNKNLSFFVNNVGSEKENRPFLFKSSTTSSGNESDSTTNDFKSSKILNNDISSAHPPDHYLSIDVCRDSFEKLKITPKQHSFVATAVANQIVSSHELQLLNDNKLEKSGYLFKLSGKFKVWKKRWFVLKEGNLLYYKRKNGDGLNDMPKGKIVLDQNCSLIRAKEYSFHLSYQDGKKNLHLSCDSIESYNEWLRVIGQTLTINNILKLQDNQVPIIENHIIKVRFGHSIKCWTALYNHHLIYFNNPFEKIPIGYTSLKDCTFQEITTSVPDVEDVALIYDDIKKNIHYSISIHPKGNSEPIYLLFMTKQDFSLWYYHLKLALAENNIPRTAFENVLTTLLNIESSTSSKEEFYTHEIWNNSLLTFSNDENISEPLISLYNNELKKEALKLFRSIKLFVSVPIDSSAIDYHVTLIQNCLQVCFDLPELQAELYYQLIKLSSPNINHQIFSSSKHSMNTQHTFWCSPHSIFKCEESTSSPEQFDPDASEAIISTTSTSDHLVQKNSFFFLQCLQFLAITISIFLPQNQVLWLLKHHINRFKDETTELGKYFLYCERALTRTLLNGGRKRIPSRMEVLSIIQRNPYQHSMPHSIPVHFANNSYQVIGFDGSTTVSEFIKLINSESGIRDNIYSGFALYSDDPIEKDIEHLLDLPGKLADAISYWESTMRKYNLGKFENTKIIKLTYKHRLCLKKHFKNETDKERLIWIYEINNEVISNRFPVTLDLSIELMSLMIQIEYGNFQNYISNIDQILKQASARFLPEKFHNAKCLNDIVSKRWFELEERSVLDCVRIYLNCTRKWNLCGCKLFQAKVFNCLKYDDLASLYLYKFFLKHSLLWIAIGEDFIELTEYESFRPILRISYRNVLNYGYLKSYFILTIDQSCLSELISLEKKSENVSFRNQILNKNGHRLFFTLTEQKIIQIITLISDYIEIKKQQTTTND